MKIQVRLSICNERNKPFMGIGIVWLLQRVEKFRSLNLAAKDMEMSYAKAHRIVRQLEQELGKEILTSKHGGSDRGGSDLTPYAKKFIKRYEDFASEAKKQTEMIFKRHFSGTYPAKRKTQQ